MRNAKSRNELIQAATAVCRDIPLRKDFSAGGVGAAIRTVAGNIYTGVCIDLACGLGFCAEVAAMAEMIKNGETHIVDAVAVKRGGVLPPCGRCRETMAQLDIRNLDCMVIMSEEVVVPLRELLPGHWLEE